MCTCINLTLGRERHVDACVDQAEPWQISPTGVDGAQLGSTFLLKAPRACEIFHDLAGSPGCVYTTECCQVLQIDRIVMTSVVAVTALSDSRLSRQT